MKRTWSGKTGLATGRAVAALSVLLFLCFAGCAHRACSPSLIAPVGEWHGHGDCLTFGEGGATSLTPRELDCLIWEYDGEGFLAATHANACFNCGPEVDATISVGPAPPGSSGFRGTIRIEETELSGSMDCICLFDLDYTLSDLPPGRYWVEVSEEGRYLLPEDELLEFELTLSGAGADSFCVVRDHYPWTMTLPGARGESN
jgi:hypothetical protein